MQYAVADRLLFRVFRFGITHEDMKGRVTVKFPRIWITFLIGISILSSRPSPLAQLSGQYTGRKISLDFKDADIRNILGLISEAAQLNIVVGGDKGPIPLIHSGW